MPRPRAPAPPAPPVSAGHPLILFPLSACSVSNYSFGLKSPWRVTPCLMPCLNPWVHSRASPCLKELQTISTAKQHTLPLKSAPLVFFLPWPWLLQAVPTDPASVVLRCQLWASQVRWWERRRLPPTNARPAHSKPCDPHKPIPGFFI